MKLHPDKFRPTSFSFGTRDPHYARVDPKVSRDPATLTTGATVKVPPVFGTLGLRLVNRVMCFDRFGNISEFLEIAPQELYLLLEVRSQLIRPSESSYSRMERPTSRDQNLFG